MNKGSEIILVQWGIILDLSKDDDNITMSDCLFDGINHYGFIRYSIAKKAVFGKKPQEIKIIGCTFNNCVAGVIDKKNHDSDSNESVIISNCTGLEGTGGGEAVNPLVRQESKNGEPIGARIKDDDVGVPLYQGV